MLFKKENSIYFRRPLFLTLTVTLAAWALCLFTEGKEKLYCALALSALSLCALFLLFLPVLRKATALHIAFTLLLASLPFYSSYFQIDHRVENLCREEVTTVTMQAEELLSESTYGGTYRVHLTTIGDRKASSDALVFIDSANKPKKDEKITASATISSLKDDQFGTYYMADGLLTRLEVEEFLSFEEGSAEYLTQEKTSIAAFLSSIYQKSLGEENGALMSALFLGDKSSLHESTLLGFRRLGISHLAAVSGLHISILIYGIERLLRRLTLHRYARTAACLLLLCTYLSVIGFPVSAVRASTMYLLVVLSYYLGGRYDSMTALSFVAVFLCFLSPYTIYDAAFWLSVTATAGVLAVLQKEEPLNPNAPRVPKIPIRNLKTLFLRLSKPVCAYIKTSFLITFGAVCATFPITAFLFGEISVFSALATLLLSPLVNILLYGALLLPFLHFVPFVPWLLKAAAGCSLAIIKYFSSYDFALISLGDDLLKYSILLGVAVLVFMKILPFEKKLHRRIVYGALSLALSVVIAFTLILPLRERSLIYERNDSNESVFLFDRGEYSLFLFDTIQADLAVTQLTAHGCTYLHNLCLTGYTETVHVKLDTFLSSLKTEKVIIPAPTNGQQLIIAKKIETMLEAHGVCLAFFEKDKPFALTKEIAWTDFDFSDNRQTYRLDVHGTRFVYTVPDKLASAVSFEARQVYASADILIFGRRWIENDDYLLTDTELPDLEILVNANAYGTVRIPACDEHHFAYYRAPTVIRYTIP